MKGFEANNCRLCEKAFCCENCRVKHEINIHKVFPYCDICIYGHFSLENTEDFILKHLETCHLPLYCVYCKRVFKSIKDILQHRKCPILQHKEESPKTPFREAALILIPTEDNQSPILQEFQGQEHLKYIFNLATSTPMQKGTEMNLFEKSRETLTPVDKGSIVNSKSIIKKIDSLRSENSSNRRVTFGNTPDSNHAKTKFVEDINKVKETAGDNCDTDNIKENSENISPEPNTNKNVLEKDSNNKEVEQLEPTLNTENNFTPNLVMKSETFYSAKSEQFHSAKEQESNNIEIRQHIKLEEGFTPVAAPNPQKILKGQICKKDFIQQESPDTNKATINTKNEDNFNEVSMALCTPEVPQIISRIERITENNMPAIIENTKENIETLDDESQENDLQVGHNTMWLSAINSEEMNNLAEVVNKHSPEPKLKPEHNSEGGPSSPLKTNRRVSIFVGTPLIKRTNVQMKFQFPAHLSSTPIISNNTVKIKHTKIVEEISTKVVTCQTPFKTPQGKLFKIAQRKLGQNSNMRRNFVLSPMIEPTTSENSYRKGDYLIKQDVEAETDIFPNENQENIPSVIKSHVSESHISVSSMTESSLWTSMAKIVKSVLGGLTHSSNPEISHTNTHRNTPSSFKRLHSDSDDFFNAPRLKRIKFTDIKCRRPIRKSGELVPISKLPVSKLPSSNVALTRLEIVNSVSTLYGGEALRIQCDKSTQTDDYLMYGWYPKT